jgi:hypothetical protein
MYVRVEQHRESSVETASRERNTVFRGFLHLRSQRRMCVWVLRLTGWIPWQQISFTDNVHIQWHNDIMFLMFTRFGGWLAYLWHLWLAIKTVYFITFLYNWGWRSAKCIKRKGCVVCMQWIRKLKWEPEQHSRCNYWLWAEQQRGSEFDFGIFFVISFYLQSVLVHSANNVKTYTMTYRRVLSSALL